MDRTGLIAMALSKAQGEFHAVTKSRTAIVPTKAGGKYTYRYADLSDVFAAIKPALAKYELAVTQGMIRLEGEDFLQTRLIHSSGEVLENHVPLTGGGTITGPQALGSALTYARRYGLTSLIGIAAEEDDDAQGAEAHEKEHAAHKTREHYNAKRETQRARTPEEDAARAVDALADQYVIPLGEFKGKRLSEVGKGHLIDLVPKVQASLGEMNDATRERAEEMLEEIGAFLGVKSASRKNKMPWIIWQRE